MKLKNKKLILIAFIAFFVFKLVFRDALEIFSKDNIVIQVIGNTILLILILVFSKNDLYDDYKLKFYPIRKKTKLKVILYMCLVVILSNVLVKILFKLILHSKPLIATNEAIADAMQEKFPIIMFIIPCIMAPIIEEYIFREVLYRCFLKFGVKTSIVLTGFMFGIMHFSASIGNSSFVTISIQAISYISIGIYFGYLRHKYDSLILTIFLHFLNNTFASIINLIAK